jgi:hypothetical protein
MKLLCGQVLIKKKKNLFGNFLKSAQTSKINKYQSINNDVERIWPHLPKGRWGQSFTTVI